MQVQDAFSIELQDQVRRKWQRERRWTSLSTLLARIVLVVLFVGAWELVSGWLIEPFYITSPSAVLRQTIKWINSGTLWYHLQFTLIELSLGYLLGAVTAVSMALVLGLLVFFYEVVEPLVLVLYSIPAIALAPLLIMWLGVGLLPKVLLTAFFVFFIIFMNTIRAIRNVDRGILKVAQTLGASRSAIINKVIVPAVLPYMLVSLGIAVPDAVVGAVVGEFIASYRGIAFLISMSSAKYNAAGVFSALIVLALVVVILNAGVSFVVRTLAKKTAGMA
jgi:NitT/TauT family transport system permease protein